MKKRTQIIIIWIISFIITACIGYYQRRTGPTHSIKGKEKIKNIMVKYKFLRSYVEHKKLPIKIKTNNDVKAYLYCRRYKTDENWRKVEMKKDDN